MRFVCDGVLNIVGKGEEKIELSKLETLILQTTKVAWTAKFLLDRKENMENGEKADY